MALELSADEARRVALAAQGFGVRKPERPSAQHLRKVIDRIGLFQIDSVNVLTRAHYLPALSRLGPYDRTLLERDAWGPKRHRRLFEYWAHEASLLPLDLHPLLRWRMAKAERGEIGYKALRRFASEHKAEADAVLARIAADGPLTASDLEDGKSRSGWWEWSHTKHALEYLFWAGRITTSTRRGSFTRVYDLTERVIPTAVLELATPEPADAQRALIERSARALGVATAADLRDYFRLKPAEGDPAVVDLVEAGVLVPVKIRGWSMKAWMHRDARLPRSSRAAALLAPFDPVVWERSRTERLFDFRYRIEIYVPSRLRTHGYYVLPFLLNEALVARVDLKADRKAQTLRAPLVTFQADAPREAIDCLMRELDTMASWLGLASVQVGTVVQAI